MEDSGSGLNVVGHYDSKISITGEHLDVYDSVGLRINGQLYAPQKTNFYDGAITFY